MIFQILNGDALTDRFLALGLKGEVIVMRECLIEGGLSGNSLDEFIKTRATYLSETYPSTSDTYHQKVVTEFEKLLQAPDHSEFNLWFGYDLFCMANMWFIISLLHQLSIEKKVFIVYPSYLKKTDIWQDFGSAGSEELYYSFNNRLSLTEKDLQLSQSIWNAYKEHDLIKLRKLSEQQFLSFPYLREVCQAHIARFPAPGKLGRPEKVIAELISDKNVNFTSIFEEFTKREGVYGFGDLQVKKIYDKVLQSRS
ncbi:hypothetical protein JAO76_16175 [Pontibacter sp. BT310]|uniref:DUF1835 domain-containing protein n=1 Tax=Pontibacter populi TaxID=890055 RepID=A0ABS6XF28_9BACT|nr:MULTISPECIES: DUF1835 domain-containing protein [Pontibacter]MBJ6119745.1 hypothetical protein [Pontibacter sp. BT310]MBR0572174.1 hypothetical protein [Microvirga sp. STS03]MBW3366598.1 hypothetical protein [Pontibacter populi]